MTSHYLNQCWSSLLTYICGNRGRWVNLRLELFVWAKIFMNHHATWHHRKTLPLLGSITTLTKILSKWGTQKNVTFSFPLYMIVKNGQPLCGYSMSFIWNEMLYVHIKLCFLSRKTYYMVSYWFMSSAYKYCWFITSHMTVCHPKVRSASWHLQSYTRPPMDESEIKT